LPQFSEAFSLSGDGSGQADPMSGHWQGYFFIEAKERLLVGNGGFKGGPDQSGLVEIGYEIAPSYWNRGFATEAVRGMIEGRKLCQESFPARGVPPQTSSIVIRQGVRISSTSG
jgi:GNAT acetyltransferase-like protein